MAELIASEMVFRVADGTLQLFGGAGYRKDEPIERIWRDVRAIRILEAILKLCATSWRATCCAIRRAQMSHFPQSEDGSHDHAN